MIRKPAQYFHASLEDGVLKISATREALIHFTRMVLGICLLDLVILAAYGYVRAPLTIFDWGLILVVGTVGIVGGGIILYRLQSAPEWRFDRTTDQFLKDKKLIGRLQDIREICLIPEQGEDRKMWHALSVVLEGTAPCCLHKQEQSEELRTLANTIGNYVGVPVTAPAVIETPTDLWSIATAPRWLQLTSVAIVFIGPFLLVIRHGLASQAEKFIYTTLLFPLALIFFSFIYIRGKRIASQESDTHVRKRLLEKHTRDFRLLLMITIPTSLVGVATSAWLIFVQFPQNR